MDHRLEEGFSHHRNRLLCEIVNAHGQHHRTTPLFVTPTIPPLLYEMNNLEVGLVAYASTIDLPHLSGAGPASPASIRLPSIFHYRNSYLIEGLKRIGHEGPRKVVAE